mmetsp:Transcript_68172/g.211229  ORF Transcript_68172/g.211229 Transcript_68172/m.211229 type:complete len:279 (+) Transcript_68172:2-838(+)
MAGAGDGPQGRCAPSGRGIGSGIGAGARVGWRPAPSKGLGRREAALLDPAPVDERQERAGLLQHGLQVLPHAAQGRLPEEAHGVHVLLHRPWHPHLLGQQLLLAREVELQEGQEGGEDRRLALHERQVPEPRGGCGRPGAGGERQEVLRREDFQGHAERVQPSAGAGGQHAARKGIQHLGVAAQAPQVRVVVARAAAAHERPEAAESRGLVEAEQHQGRRHVVHALAVAHRGVQGSTGPKDTPEAGPVCSTEQLRLRPGNVQLDTPGRVLRHLLLQRL